MLTVIIPTLDDELRLVPTLSALVPGAADGLVIEVIVVDGGSRDGVERIADMAGCRFMTGPTDRAGRIAAAARVAKAPWLLILEPGAVLEEGWLREVRLFVETVMRRGDEGRRVGSFTAGVDGFGAGARAQEWFLWLRVLIGFRPTPAQGLLVFASHYRSGGARGAVTMLRSRATMVESG